MSSPASIELLKRGNTSAVLKNGSVIVEIKGTPTKQARESEFEVSAIRETPSAAPTLPWRQSPEQPSLIDHLGPEDLFDVDIQEGSAINEPFEHIARPSFFENDSLTAGSEAKQYSPYRSTSVASSLYSIPLASTNLSRSRNFDDVPPPPPPQSESPEDNTYTYRQDDEQPDGSFVQFTKQPLFKSHHYEDTPVSKQLDFSDDPLGDDEGFSFQSKKSANRSGSSKRFSTQLANDLYAKVKRTPDQSKLVAYHGSTTKFSMENLGAAHKKKKDSLAIDLDRFKYVPQFHDLKNVSFRTSTDAEAAPPIQRTESSNNVWASNVSNTVVAGEGANGGTGLQDLVKDVLNQPFSTLNKLRHYYNNNKEKLLVKKTSSSQVTEPPQEAEEKQNQSMFDTTTSPSSFFPSPTVTVTSPLSLPGNDPIPNQPLNFHPIEKELQRGAMFVKTTSRGTAHHRYVTVSKDMKNVEWRAPNEAEINAMPLRNCRILLGQQTTPFLRRNQPSAQHRCFSIVSDERTLDLEIISPKQNRKEDEDIRNEWAEKFQWAIARATVPRNR